MNNNIGPDIAMISSVIRFRRILERALFQPPILILPLRTLKSSCIAFVSSHYYLLLRFRAIIVSRSNHARVKDKQHVSAIGEFRKRVCIASDALSVQECACDVRTRASKEIWK